MLVDLISIFLVPDFAKGIIIGIRVIFTIPSRIPGSSSVFVHNTQRRGVEPRQFKDYGAFN